MRKPAVQVELDLPPPEAGGPWADDVEFEPAWWQTKWSVAVLASATALLLALTIGARIAAHRDGERAAALEAEVRQLTLRPSTQLRTVRITPNPRSWSATPEATIRAPEPPEILDLHLPMAYSEFKSFAVTIDKVDAGRVMLLQRVTPDSNRELRLSFNSSLLAPGEYRIRLQGYTWRGELVDAGWVRLVMAPAR